MRLAHALRVSNEADARQRFLEELAALTDDLEVGTPSHPGHIPARAREPRDEAKLDRIRGAQHDDWNRPGGLLRRQGRGGRSRCDRVDIQPNKLSRKVSQTIGFPLRESKTPGTTSLRRSNRFALSSGESWLRPVMLPPGRATLATKPVPTGSPTPTMTMGIVLVACWAARIAGALTASGTPGLKRADRG